MTSTQSTQFSPYLAVHASAGSGKTHQLVNRLVYLLLHGAEPGGILAITFTRKAASEMTERLLQRVQLLCTDDESELQHQLAALGVDATPELIQRAANLYETLLHTPYPVRSTTFHAFCQDLLRRFPMEADVPPGFELVELTRQLLDEAWDSLASDLTRSPSSELAGAMDRLLHQLGLHECRRVLFQFVEHRSDWWALTHGREDPVEFVYARLRENINVDEVADPLAEFFADSEVVRQLQEFLDLLYKQPGKNNNDSAAQLEIALSAERDYQTRFFSAWLAFYTKDKDTPRSRELKDAVIKKLGEGPAQRFVFLHSYFCDRLAAVRRRQHAIDTLRLSQAWLRGGEALLGHFQRIKLDQRILDFADLEWNSFLLLNAASHADWVQYKLDQRIDHLLVDEFQDTNPIQWRLLLPLLQELAATGNDRHRSVMFVGDSKQSIYSFRRAEPRLFDAATRWLQDHLPDTRQQTLSKSWRSSPAIIEFVNTVFDNNPDLHLSHFETHATAHPDLYGQVWLLPLAPKQKPAALDGLRNPLTTPRPQPDAAHYHEACLIAETINSLINRQTVVGRSGHCRYLRYSDIMILFRSRTRVSDYEQALREAHIPYIGTERGTLLDSLEVSDMMNLLQWLITPFNNLALAGILRSPLFSASDDDLMQLAGKGDWFTRLLELAPNLDPEQPLARAARHLQRWIPLADQLPVHDLLDRIYSETNLFARYRAAFPQHLHPRVIANLTRFLELALETDSGRYPSLTRFMVWLEQLRQLDKEAPSQPPGQGEQDRVRLLTIHEAKGLEAPVVFVADASRTAPADHGTRILVEWPADHAMPQHFMLSPGGKFPNDYSAEVMARLQTRQALEDANLLYVALTRAEQYLYISASNKADSWYQQICHVHDIDSSKLDLPQCLREGGKPPPAHLEIRMPEPTTVSVNPGLQKVLDLPAGIQEIAPSRQVAQVGTGQHSIDEDARERGIMIHHMLDLLAADPNRTLSSLHARFNDVDVQRLTLYWEEARRVLQAYPEYFLADRYERAYTEVPVVYRDNGRTVYGIIDRLVCYPDRLLVIDYKTQRCSAETDLVQLAAPYREQLRLYADGIRQVFPGKPVDCAILFTALPQSLALAT